MGWQQSVVTRVTGRSGQVRSDQIRSDHQQGTGVCSLVGDVGQLCSVQTHHPIRPSAQAEEGSQGTAYGCPCGHNNGHCQRQQQQSIYSTDLLEFMTTCLGR